MNQKIDLHDAQKQVYYDTHRYKVVCAGRRFGKSVLADLIAIKWAISHPNGVVWIVSPTYRQGEAIHWRGIQQLLAGKDWIVKKNERPVLQLTFKNGSVIELKGAENPDALRGVKLRGLVIDEIASIRNWDWLWAEVLRPTLTDYKAPAVFISTPKGYNHFYELFEIGQNSTGDEDYKSWRFTSYDNPYIEKGEIDAAKKELTEDTFAQEYLADFRKFTGLVYKDFNRETHVIEPFDIPDSWEIYRGIDFGSTNPTACLFIAVDPDENWYVFKEHYETGQTIDYHAGVINSLSDGLTIRATYGDPSGAQWISEFNQRGIYITPANKEVGTNFNSWVRYGIEKVGEKLKAVAGHTVPNVQLHSSRLENAMPSLFIFSSCISTIREIESYRWKEKSVTQAQDLNEPDVPEKANDHAMDALRYVAVSYKKSDPMSVYATKKHNKQILKKWEIG